jgi:hypothetical protein
MDSKAMSPLVPGQMQQLQAVSQKAFSRNSDEAPSPNYVNNVEFAASGMDVFMDTGTVSPEAIRDALEIMKSSDKTPAVKFIVDFRFGMSIQTAIVMHQRLSALLQAHSSAVMKTDTETAAKESAPAKDV